MGGRRKNIEPSKTILIITVGFMVVYSITKIQWLLYTSIFVGGFGLLSNYFAEKVSFIWMKLTWILSLILPRIILSVIYYLILTPIAFLSNIFGEKNQLTLKNTKKSLFIDTNKEFKKDLFEKLW